MREPLPRPVGGPDAGRLILVSNRLPVTTSPTDRGWHVQPSVGGLASALWPVHEEGSGLWIGSPGQLPADPAAARNLTATLRARRLIPVGLSPKLVDDFYHGFCNSTLWPLFHYLAHLSTFDRSWWAAYREVNHAFSRAVERVWQPGDTIWVHDYHLMLLPGLLRQSLPDARIGFFLHTPFPSAELFRMLPWRRELLAGVLGADLAGFHVYAYLRHFRRSVARILGGEGDHDIVHSEGRAVRLGAFPVGIDVRRFADAVATDSQVGTELERLSRELRGRRLILGVDRMDYTKGIPERLLGYERFLERYPSSQGQVELIQIGVPTRSRVGDYQDLRQRVEQIVGRINGRFGSAEWTPVKYLYRPVPFPRLCALYGHAAIMLVTPLRDGMNLVAKEYVASKHGRRDGVLVLSEFAGAAGELVEAVLVNPFDREDVASALHQALTMSLVERRSRLGQMMVSVERSDVGSWRRTFLGQLERSGTRASVYPLRLAGEVRADLAAAWRGAERRALLLDYDGTLQRIFPRPELARPDRPLIELLGWLATLEGVELAVVSGRDRTSLERWLGGLPVTLIAEHGRWTRTGDRWVDVLAGRLPAWLGRVRELFDGASEITPGSFTEVKSASVAWHYRGADCEQADLRVEELLEQLRELHEDPPVNVLVGKKAIEARIFGVSKGSAVMGWLAERPPIDFLLAAGDDATDEEMFGLLPPTAWSLHVGSAASCARFSLESPAALRELLQELGRAIEGVRT